MDMNTEITISGMAANAVIRLIREHLQQDVVFDERQLRDALEALEWADRIVIDNSKG